MLSPSAAPHAEIFEHIEALWKKHSKATHILVDIPIGLPDGDRRACDCLARVQLRQRRNSVFFVPVRATLGAQTYREACDVNERVTNKRISQQTWHILPKVREMDTWLRTNEDARNVVSESHPELCFWALAGGKPMEHVKKSDAGKRDRMDILRSYIPSIEDILESVLSRHLRKEVATDDVLDAAALAVAASGLAGPLRSLPPEPPTDTAGLPMQMVYPAFSSTDP